MNSNKKDGSEKTMPELSPKVPVEPAVRATQGRDNPPNPGDAIGANAAEEFPFRISKNLYSFRRTWMLTPILGIALAAPLVLVTYMLNPVVFTAVEFVRIASSDSKLIFEAVDASHFDETRYNIYKNTQRQLLLLPLSLNKALKDSDISPQQLVKEPIDLASDPIDWLARNIEVKFPDSSEMMTVSLTLQDPVAAHRIVKSVVDVYMNDVVDKDRAERLYRIERLERILVELEDKARKKRNELSKLCDSLGASDEGVLNLAQQINLQKVALILPELRKIELDLLKVQGETSLEKSSETNSNNQSDDPESSRDGNRLKTPIAWLEKQKGHLNEELRAIEAESRKFGRSSIDVEMMRREIAGLDPILERASQELERTKIELQGSSRITRYPSSGVPKFGDSNERIPRTAAAGVFGFVAAFVFLLWRDLNRSPMKEGRGHYED